MNPRWLAIAGLIANMLGTLMLLRWPPRVQQYTADGRPIYSDEGPQMVEGKRQHDIHVSGYQLAVGLVLLGFFLQLLSVIDS